MPLFRVLRTGKKFWQRAVRRVPQIIAREGWSGLIRQATDVATAYSYPLWIRRYDTLGAADRERLRHDIANWPNPPLISVLVPVVEGEPQHLRDALHSVVAQLYPNWELCVALHASASAATRRELARSASPGKIRIVEFAGSGPASARNAALAAASGAFVALLDPNDRLAEHALYWVAREILQHPDCDLIFSDEDRIDARGRRHSPNFKPDWNPALMLSQNAFGNPAVFRRELLTRLGGFRDVFQDADDYDAVLRCAHACGDDRIRHIPRVLYHAGATSTAPHRGPSEAARKVVEAHLRETDTRATVVATAHGLQVEYAPPDPAPLVSIVVPTTARPETLGPCVRSVLGRSRYSNFELLLAVGEKHRAMPERAALLDQIAQDARVRVLTYPDRPFNYAWTNNWAAAQARGSLLCLLNDDTELITPDWLERLTARVSGDRVAAAGAMLYRPDDTIQHAGVIVGPGGGAVHAFSGEPRGSGGYQGRAALEQDLSCVTAACMLIRRDVFDAVNGFDERFAIAFNDVDLCLRVRAAGWRIVWTPAVELYHAESISVGPHDAPERARSFAAELALLRERWGPLLECDSNYNLNLSVTRPFALAAPPRHR